MANTKKNEKLLAGIAATSAAATILFAGISTIEYIKAKHIHNMADEHGELEDKLAAVETIDMQSYYAERDAQLDDITQKYKNKEISVSKRDELKRKTNKNLIYEWAKESKDPEVQAVLAAYEKKMKESEPYYMRFAMNLSCASISFMGFLMSMGLLEKFTEKMQQETGITPDQLTFDDILEEMDK